MGSGEFAGTAGPAQMAGGVASDLARKRENACCSPSILSVSLCCRHHSDRRSRRGRRNISGAAASFHSAHRLRLQCRRCDQSGAFSAGSQRFAADTTRVGIGDMRTGSRIGLVVLCRFGRPHVNIGKAVGAADPRMPVIPTAAHALLQIITVALGSPLGRRGRAAQDRRRSCRVAFLSHWLRCRGQPDHGRLWGGRGGLAAVYNIPIGGCSLFSRSCRGHSACLPSFPPSLRPSLRPWWHGSDWAMRRNIQCRHSRSPRPLSSGRSWRGRFSVLRPMGSRVSPRRRTPERRETGSARLMPRCLPCHRSVGHSVSAVNGQRKKTNSNGVRQ
jgi:hypothetical protein